MFGWSVITNQEQEKSKWTNDLRGSHQMVERAMKSTGVLDSYCSSIVIGSVLFESDVDDAMRINKLGVSNPEFLYRQERYIDSGI